MKRKMEGNGLEMKQEPDMSPATVNSEVEAVNSSQKGESADVRSVLVVGAGPAGLMLAYVHHLGPSSPF
jgi:NADPH-dependent 2,4-dienoyl-CoA reductase/sulfur reductase-like enzyme